MRQSKLVPIIIAWLAADVAAPAQVAPNLVAEGYGWQSQSTNLGPNLEQQQAFGAQIQRQALLNSLVSPGATPTSPAGTGLNGQNYTGSDSSGVMQQVFGNSNSSSTTGVPSPSSFGSSAGPSGFGGMSNAFGSPPGTSNSAGFGSTGLSGTGFDSTPGGMTGMGGSGIDGTMGGGNSFGAGASGLGAGTSGLGGGAPGGGALGSLGGAGLGDTASGMGGGTLGVGGNGAPGFGSGAPGIGSGGTGGFDTGAGAPDGSGGLPGAGELNGGVGGGASSSFIHPGFGSNQPPTDDMGTDAGADADASADESGSARGGRTNAPPDNTGTVSGAQTDTALRRALADLHARSYESCLTKLTGILERDPRNGQAHYLKAVAYVMTKRYTQAADEYRAAIKFSTNQDIVHRAQAGLAKLNQ